MAWTIEYDEGAVKDLKKLDHQVQRDILDFMEKRIGQAKDPRSFGKPLRHSKFGLWRYRLRGILLMAVAAVLVVAALPLFGRNIGDYIGRGDVTTLTGRTEMWAYVIQEIKSRPFIGYGYEVAGMTDPASPRAALVPPNGVGRFHIVVEGANNGDLIHAWSELCKPNPDPSPEFKAIYQNVTTVQGNRFQFRGGDPQVMKDNLQKLFEKLLKRPLKVKIEA